MHSRNTFPKEIKEQLAKLKTGKGGLGKKEHLNKMKPERSVYAKIRDINRINFSARLKTRKGNLGKS